MFSPRNGFQTSPIYYVPPFLKPVCETATKSASYSLIRVNVSLRECMSVGRRRFESAVRCPRVRLYSRLGKISLLTALDH
jgi:hypothetical protein